MPTILENALMTEKLKTNTIKFKINDHLIRLINNGCATYQYNANEYVSILLKQGFHEFESRIEHENPSKVLVTMKDAMDFFKFDDTQLSAVKFERSMALELKLTSKEYEKELIELATMFICHAILRH